jgi:predicted nucleotidyltransferase
MTEHSQRGFPQVTKVSIDRATIQAVAQLIAQKFDPEQIILFGSHARGNAGSHSDIDLLLVLKSLDNWPKRGNPIRRAIGEKFILPVDVLVITPDRLAEQSNNPYSFVNTALESKEILYERQAS